MSKLNMMPVVSINSSHWYACIEIYRAVFPAWEREPETLIAKRVQQGRYLLFAGIDAQDKVMGFYLLDVVVDLDYALLAFLAVAETKRGNGYGTQLCQAMIDYFQTALNLKWLLTEAEDRQALFYAALGFKKLGLDYNVPQFDAQGSVAMHLMLINQDQAHHIQKNTLSQIIEYLFIDGYQLSQDDVRIKQQIALIPDMISLDNKKD